MKLSTLAMYALAAVLSIGAVLYSQGVINLSTHQVQEQEQVDAPKQPQAPVARSAEAPKQVSVEDQVLRERQMRDAQEQARQRAYQQQADAIAARQESLAREERDRVEREAQMQQPTQVNNVVVQPDPVIVKRRLPQGSADTFNSEPDRYVRGYKMPQVPHPPQ